MRALPARLRAVRPVALLRLLLGILIPLLLVGALAEDVLERERFTFEAPLLLAVHAHASPTLNHLAVALHILGGAVVIAPVSALVLAALWLRRRAAAPFFLVAVAGAALITGVMKLAFHRPRPELWPRLIQESGASFPSGHATYSAAFVVAVMLLAWHSRWRWPVLVLGALFTLAVGASRVYLGVHYPTDVLAGWLTGLAWTLGVYGLLPIRAWHSGRREA